MWFRVYSWFAAVLGLTGRGFHTVLVIVVVSRSLSPHVKEKGEVKDEHVVFTTNKTDCYKLNSIRNRIWILS